MAKKIAALVLLLAAFAAGAVVNANLQNPVDYTSPGWKSVCVYNRPDASGQYRGEITWDPIDGPSGTRGVTLSTSRSVTSLPVAYQTFVNAWIGFARTDFPAFN